MKQQATTFINHLNLCIMAGLIIVLPFATDDSLMFPTQSAKFFLFCLATIVIFSLFLLQFIFQKESKPSQSYSQIPHQHSTPPSHSQRTWRKSDKTFHLTTLDILLALFLLYTAASVLFHLNRYGISHRFVELIGLSAMYLVFRKLDGKSIKVLFIALLISGTAQAIYGNLQLYGIYPSHHNMFSITGGFFNPGPYAGFLAVIFPMALVMYFASSGDSKIKSEDSKITLFNNLNVQASEVFRYISITAIVAILLVLPATRSRAAWLAVIATTVFIFIDKYDISKEIKNRVNSPPRQQAGMTKKIAVITFAVILSGLANTGLYIMKKGSADGRLLIWKVTTNMIGEKPVFGFGYDRFKANYLNYQADYFSSGFSRDPTGELAQARRLRQYGEAVVADNSTRAFNEYLQMTVEGGLIGFLNILAVGWSFFFGASRNKETGPTLMAAKMGVLAFGVFALFSYPTEILPIKLCVTIFLAWVATNQKPKHINTFHGFLPTKVARSIWITASIAGLIGILSLTLPLNENYESYKNWKQAYFTYQMRAYKTSVEEYQEIYEQLKNNGEYLVNYGKACSMAGQHEQAIEVLTRAAQFLPNTIVYTAMGDSYKKLNKSIESEQAYIKASNILPDRFYPRYLLAKLYDETNQQAKAVQTANELLQKDIKVNSMAVEEIKAEMQAIVNKVKMSTL